MSDESQKTIEAVGKRLEGYGRVAIAVSGGIDSLTLATLAARRLGTRAEMFHAVSPAVPPEATDRVREVAARQRWRLQIIDAGEFRRNEYLTNPVNRCFFCKQSLYAAISRSTSSQILSGTNADDLGEYRPGLDAARDSSVHHPFAELGVGKPAIRRIARVLGLGGLSELPASPCLSSRVETGIGITPALLRLIHASENAVRARVSAASVRCRMRQSGVVIELDAETLATLTQEQRQDIANAVGRIFAPDGSGPIPAFAPYRVGSAFLVRSHDRARHPA